MSDMKRLPFLLGVCFVGIIAVAFFLWNAAEKTESKPAAALASTPIKQPTQKPVKATALSVPQNDANDLLGVMMWRFDVTLPQPHRDLRFVLELREKGKAPQHLVSVVHFKAMDAPADGHLKIFVGFHPLSGVMRESEKAKYMVRINDYRIAKLMTAAARSTAGVEPNAFNGYQGYESSGAPPQRKDGSFVLISGNRKSASSRKVAPDTELVFIVRDYP